ncbi:MAG: hypothetical protein LH649_00375 [Pseudanabaena sp. CAN_BIN31]|nr:hypothetical protein [Pseudanabaena sp. CAN_BIN31]
MTNGFTRQETIDLTGIDSGRLSYLDRTKLVVPLKFGNPKHPKVVYSWQQVLGEHLSYAIGINTDSKKGSKKGE